MKAIAALSLLLGVLIVPGCADKSAKRIPEGLSFEEAAAYFMLVDQLEIAATEESAAGRYRDICVGVHVGEGGVEQGVSDTLLKALQESVPSQLNAVLKSASDCTGQWFSSPPSTGGSWLLFAARESDKKDPQFWRSGWRCGGLCGHGHAYFVTNKAGHAKVTRSAEWIS